MHVLRPPVIACGFVALAISFPAIGASVDWTGCSVPNFGEDRSKAIAACTAVLNRADLTNADRARALIVRGRAEHRANEIDAAIRDYDEAITLAPNDPEPLAFRASAAFFKHDLAGASAFNARALKFDPNHPVALDTQGVLEETAGNYTAAKFAYDKVIALDPNDVVARFHRFQYWKGIGAGPQALKEIEDLMALHTSRLDLDYRDFRGREISYRAMARLQRAFLFESLGRFPDAIKAFDEFVQTDPGAISYGVRGWYHIDRSENDLAKADIEKALSYDPDFFLLHELQGMLFWYAGDYEHAAASFTRAIELGPDQPGGSYWWRAMAERALHHTEAAQKDALKALSSDPTFLRTKLKMFRERGYWQPPESEVDLAIAVHDAVVACMADEECW